MTRNPVAGQPKPHNHLLAAQGLPLPVQARLAPCPRCEDVLRVLHDVYLKGRVEEQGAPEPMRKDPQAA